MRSTPTELQASLAFAASARRLAALGPASHRSSSGCLRGGSIVVLKGLSGYSRNWTYFGGLGFVRSGEHALQGDLQRVAPHALAPHGQRGHPEDAAVSQAAQMLPGSLGLRRPMPDLEHHRQDLALVLLDHLASRVEAHNRQRKQDEPLELCQDTPGLVEREGLPILLDLQLLLRRVPLQVGHVVALVQDQYLLSILDALRGG